MSQITNMLKGYEERVVEVLRGGSCVVRWMYVSRLWNSAR